MFADAQYELALAAAIRLLRRLDAGPCMARHERLAAAIFIILDAIRAGHAEPAAVAAGYACPEPEELS